MHHKMLQLHHMHDTSWQVHRFWSKSPKICCHSYT